MSGRPNLAETGGASRPLEALALAERDLDATNARVRATHQRHVSWRDPFRVVATDPVSGVVAKVRAHTATRRVGGTVVRSPGPRIPTHGGTRCRRAPSGWRIGLGLPGAIPGWGSTIQWSCANTKIYVATTPAPRSGPGRATPGRGRPRSRPRPIAQRRLKPPRRRGCPAVYVTARDRASAAESRRSGRITTDDIDDDDCRSVRRRPTRSR
jgi:hypothetical protein